ERYRCAKVGRHHGRTLQRLDTRDRRGVALELDIGAEPRQLLYVHEAVFEDRFADDARPRSPGQQRHELRLQVGWETWERLRLYRDGRDTAAVPYNANAGAGRLYAGAGIRENVERGFEIVDAATFE